MDVTTRRGASWTECLWLGNVFLLSSLCLAYLLLALWAGEGDGMEWKGGEGTSLAN